MAALPRARPQRTGLEIDRASYCQGRREIVVKSQVHWGVKCESGDAASEFLKVWLQMMCQPY